MYGYVQTSEHITSSPCPIWGASSQGWGAAWPRSRARAFGAGASSPAVAVVPECTQQFVTLEHCYDRWLSNNARFKCEPKAAFSAFFLIEHVFGQLGLLKAGLSKTVLGPFTIRFDTFGGSPVFARNAWFKGCAANLQQDQAVSLDCLSLDLEALPFPCPSGSRGKEPAGSLLPSSACSRSWPSVCTERPGFHSQGAECRAGSQGKV